MKVRGRRNPDMEISRSPRRVSRPVRLKSVLLEVRPKGIYACDMEYNLSPVSGRAAQSQVDKRQFRIRNA